MDKITQSFLDSYQYQRHEIEKYEAIYGRNFISPGGKETTQKFLNFIPLGSNKIVLPDACGQFGDCVGE
ncbi:MAG: hypothetical protein GY805_15180 [Chloroflexi bacterium]|nr:hypothetical protein [Chloroflexota bacterium]